MLGKDFVYAARTLRKSPVFLITATITIALGVGASTAIFSVTNAVLLRPLPYNDPDRLVLISADMRTRNVVDTPISNENYIDLHDGARKMFEDIAAVSTFRFPTPLEDGTLEEVGGANVTPNFFSLMGAKVAIGRDFQSEDGQPQAPPDPAAAPGTVPALPVIAILSHEYWQRRYGGNPGVVGHETLNFGVNRAQIVGVLAPGFELLFRPAANVERKPDIYIALRRAYDNRNRNGFFLRAVGRLRAGVTLDRANEEAELVASQIRKTFPIYGTGGYYHHVEPMQKYLVAEVRPAILALMGAVIFLLLIACANVANLLLVKASLRERELAVRAALGGSRARLVRQMLAEALLLSAAGTILGVVLAKFGIWELIAIGPADLPRIDSITLDPYVLGFTVLAGLAAAIAFGVVPALRASRPNVMDVLRGSSRTAGLGSAGPRNAVAIIEVALSFVLLIGSGLMFRSFLELQRVRLGYDSSSMLTLQILNNRRLTTPEQRAAYTRDLQGRLSAIPGVESVTASNLLPLGGGYSPIRWGKEDALADPSKYQAVDSQIVLPGYFETVRTPVLAGRTFNDSDNSPTRNVVVIDQLLAAKAFSNQSAIGKRILIRIRTPEPEWVEIIGVVNHQLTTSLTDPGTDLFHRRLSAARSHQSLANPYRWRPGPLCPAGSERNRQARRADGDHAHAADDRSGYPGAGRHALLSHPDRELLADRRDPGERGAVRRPLDAGPAADGGNRRPNGSRRRAGEHLPTGGRPRPAVERRRNRAGRAGRPGTNARDDRHAGRHPADRSVDFRGNHRILLCDRHRIVLDPSAASGRPGSHYRAAGRITHR
jgi:putative ABC transport system permease protein